MPYLTPEEIPGDDDCRPLSIPASTEWLAIVSGALTELTKSWNWQQQGAVTVQEAVERMQAMVADYYNAGCDDCELPEGGAIIRLNDDFTVEELIDGEWQTPSEAYTIPPPPERDDPTSAERKCLAAKNAVNLLEQTYEEITDSATTGLTAIEAIAAVSVFLISAVVAPLGLVVAGLAAIGFGIWKMGYDIVEFVTSDFWDAQFTENFTCALLRCATDTAGVITFDFEAVNAELINQIEWLDPTISSYTLAGQVRWMLAQIGSDGLNAMGGTTEITDSDCDSCLSFCVLQDWDVEDYDWEIVSDAGFGALATYAPPFTERIGHRIAEGDYGTFIVFQRFLNISSDFDRIEIDYDLTPGTFTAGSYTGIQLIADGVTVVDEVLSGIGTLIWTPVTPFTGFLRFNCLLSYVNTGGSSDGHGSVLAIRFYGQGDPGIETLLGVLCD